MAKKYLQNTKEDKKDTIQNKILFLNHHVQSLKIQQSTGYSVIKIKNQDFFFRGNLKLGEARYTHGIVKDT